MRRARNDAKHGTTKTFDLSADKPTDQPSDLSADKPTDQLSDLSAQQATSPSMTFVEGLTVGAAVVGLDEGLAVGESVVARDEGLVVGETVVCLDKGIAVRESVVGLDKELVMGETVVGLDESLVVGQRLARRKAANKPTDQPSDLSANKPTDQPSDLSANKPTDDRDMSMYVFDQGRGDSDEEVAQGGPSNEPRNEPINLEEQFFIDQHNDLCEVCNQPGFLLCCEKCNLVFHMPCVGLQVEPEVFLCTYCLADDNPTERQPSEYELKRLRRIENEDDVDDDENNEDDEDDVNDEDVGTFRNEVEGGVPCAPHSTFIKRLHYLNQTPSYRRSVIENNEIIQLIKKLNQMKSRGEIGGKPCGLGCSWRYKKKMIGKHRIGRMVGRGRTFKVFPEIICTGNAPSHIEVINAIK